MERDSKKSIKEKIVAAIKLIPVLGTPLEFIIKNWGIKELSFFITGFTLALVLVFFGRIPEILISGKYKSLLDKASQSVGARTRPSHVHINLVKAPPNWVLPYIFWLEKEADELKYNKLIKGYMIESVESEELSTTLEFVWVLKASPGFVISGWAFRLTNTGSEKCFEPLKATKEVPDSISFVVPKCEKGDKLLAIIRVSWMQDISPDEFLTILHSTVM
jgi:hypothetical protein